MNANNEIHKNGADNEEQEKEKRKTGDDEKDENFLSPPTKRSKLEIVTASKVDFILILSTDVLIDLLRFGRRRQLAALEPIGRRFHVLIDVGLSSAPFIVFKYLACPIKRPAWHFKKLDEQNKLHDVEDGKFSGLSFGNDENYKRDFAFLTTTNFHPLPKYVRIGWTYIQLQEAKEGIVDSVTFTQQNHLPLLRQMKENLIGSSLFFSFYIDNSEPPCKGVFSNGSDPLEYLSTELLPLLSSEAPIIAIDAGCLNNTSVKFYEQFLVSFLSLQKIMDSSSLVISINREVENSQFCSAIPFDPIFEWLDENELKKRKKFALYIYSTESKIPVNILTEMETLETRIILAFMSSKRVQNFEFRFKINAFSATNHSDFPKRQQKIKNNETKEEPCIDFGNSNKQITYNIIRNSVK